MVRLVVRCVHGIEWVAAAEIARVLGVEGTLARREITVALPALDDRVLRLRCCDDVFLHVGDLDGIGAAKADLPALAHGVAGLDWMAGLAALGARPSTLDCVVSIEGRRRYDRTAAQDAAGSALAATLGLTYLPRAATGVQGDATARLFLRGERAVATLRIAPRPLHRRPWKLDTGPGTLHPPLAAAMVALASGERVHDPFCGDGTLAIEAALAGRRVTAADLDPARVAHTRANAARAGVAVDVTVADAADLRRAGPVDRTAAEPADLRRADLLLTNPPWSRAVATAGRFDLDRFRADAAAVAPGLCLLTDADLDVPARLRRPPTLATRLRVAGRVAHLSLVGADLPADLVRWRERAVAAGVVTEEGF